MDRSDQFRALVVIETEGVGEQANRVRTRCAARAALQILQPAHANARPLRQVLLGQSGGKAISAEQRAQIHGSGGGHCDGLDSTSLVASMRSLSAAIVLSCPGGQQFIFVRLNTCRCPPLVAALVSEMCVNCVRCAWHQGPVRLKMAVSRD